MKPLTLGIIGKVRLCLRVKREFPLPKGRGCDRSWTSPECGTVHDRDMNASINIRCSGMDALMSDSKIMLCGDRV